LKQTGEAQGSHKMKWQPALWLIFSLCLTILLSACSTSSALLPANNSQVISAGSSFGQSFTAQNPGLAGVAVMLAPSQVSGEGNLTFQLQGNTPSPEVIARATLPLSEISHQQYYRFDFPAQKDSLRKDYFLNIKLEGSGQVHFYTAEANSYIDGALYINNNPQEAQLAFRLEYKRTAYLLGLIPLFAQWIVAILIGILIFILPGWGLFSLLWTGWDNIIWTAKIGLSAGLSLALYPLLLLWTNLAGLHLGAYYAWLPPIVGIIALLWRNRSNLIDLTRKIHPNHWLLGKKFLPPVEILLADLLFLFVVGLIIVSRFWAIRSLDVPLFGDSYQHSMMAQLIVDHGGLFNSWEPYADLTTFTYHFGFHSLVAVYHWISGLNVEKSVLWTGQLINILAIIGLYPLAWKITKNRWAGVIAMLVAGLLSPMPMSYVNWGRYTQLAGQVILPTAIWISWSLLEKAVSSASDITRRQKYFSWRYLFNSAGGNLALAWFIFAGMALTHYRVLILLILFLPAFIIMDFNLKTITNQIARVVWIGIGGAVLFAPWFIRVFGGNILNIFAYQLTTLPASRISPGDYFESIGNLSTYLPVYIWILFLLSSFLGLWKRKRIIAIFLLWWLFVLVITNPDWIGLPGAGAITNFTILIAFYFPVSIIIGSVVEWLPGINRPPQKSGNTLNLPTINSYLSFGFITLIILVMAAWGLRLRLRDINIQTYALVTRPDMRAMTWIQENTPVDSRFAINSFAAFNNSAIVGSDAGWWIPLLAYRKTTVPPLTYTAERGLSADYTQQVHAFYDVIKDNGINSLITLKLFQSDNVNYIYIGQRHGSINNPGTALLDPDIISKNQNYQVVYHQDLVWIFKIEPPRGNSVILSVSNGEFK
jgi:hypothetical protein